MIITLRRQITRHKRAQTDKTLIGSILTRRRVPHRCISSCQRKICLMEYIRTRQLHMTIKKIRAERSRSLLKCHHLSSHKLKDRTKTIIFLCQRAFQPQESQLVYLRYLQLEESLAEHQMIRLSKTVWQITTLQTVIQATHLRRRVIRTRA